MPRGRPPLCQGYCDLVRPALDRRAELTHSAFVNGLSRRALRGSTGKGWGQGRLDQRQKQRIDLLRRLGNAALYPPVQHQNESRRHVLDEEIRRDLAGCLSTSLKMFPYVIGDLFRHDLLKMLMIGIGAAVARRPLPHHRAYGSVHGGSRGLRRHFLEQ